MQLMQGQLAGFTHSRKAYCQTMNSLWNVCVTTSQKGKYWKF